MQRLARHEDEAAAAVEDGAPSPTGFAWQPALDGVRALCIAAVLAFHLGAPWMPGGYLGVSVFFTLSGFLITSLLLDEVHRTGRICARAFYLRRLRRLLPAALLCLAAVAILATWGAFGARSDLQGGIVAAALQVANWEALLADRSYADLFVSPSPVAHFWSLAIEEQFYWLWPLAMAGVVAVARRSTAPGRRVACLLLAAYAAFSISAPLTARWWSTDAAYLASWPRFAEILAGAALAAVLLHRQVPRRAALLAPACASAIVVLCAVTPAGTGWAYSGGLPLFALLSVGLILGLQRPSRTQRLLSVAPVVWVGKVSYGLYIAHWPVILLLDEGRTGLDGPALAALRLAATFAVTALSFELLERPIRAGALLPPPRRYVAAAASGTAAVVILAIVALPAVPPPRSEPLAFARAATQDLSPMQGAAASGLSGLVLLDGDADGAWVVPEPPRRMPTVAVFGDSVPDWLLRDAAPSFDRTDVTLVDAADEACDGAHDHPSARDRRGKVLTPPAGCRSWRDSYPAVVEDASLPIDVAVVFTGKFVALDVLLGDRWTHPCTDLAWYLGDLEQRFAYLRRHTEHVVLVLPAPAGPGATWILPDDHAERFECVRGAVRSLAARAAVPTVDVGELLCPPAPDRDCGLRRTRDGQHIDPEDAPFVLDWLLDEVDDRVRAATELWPLRATLL